MYSYMSLADPEGGKGPGGPNPSLKFTICLYDKIYITSRDEGDYSSLQNE
jgi:hypothetical protein